MDDWYLGADPEFVLWMPSRKTIRRPHDIIGDPQGPGRERYAAVGVDGDRPTSSVELRPGMSSSGEELVNRQADLIHMLRQHYKPTGVVYRAGAYVDPEPLGGHVHLGWDRGFTTGSSVRNDHVWRLMEVITAWQEQSDYLLPLLWDPIEIVARETWARANGRRDFAQRYAVRPEGGMETVMDQKHIEYRFLPSWLNSPEAAYAVLGGAEVIVREIMNQPVGRRQDWSRYIREMYTDRGISPPNGPPLAKALAVAGRYKTTSDFSLNW